MMLRRMVALAPALLLAVTLVGCGDDAGDDAGGDDATSLSPSTDAPSDAPTTSPSPDATDTPTPDLPTPSEPGGVTTAPAPEPSVPSGEADPELQDLWQTELASLIDASVPPAERASRIVDGDDLVPTIRKVDQAIAGFGAEFAVTSTEASGPRGVAEVAITSGGESFGSVPGVEFALVDGDWRLTRAGACSLAQVAGVTCT